MTTRLIVPLLCAGALALACSTRVHSDNATPKRAVATAGQTTSTIARHATPAEAKLASSFGVRVDSATVRFAFDITNVGGKHVELAFRSGQAYDIVVVDSLGREVWRWTQGRVFTQAMQTKLLGSGDAYRVAEAWDEPHIHGRYTAIAMLNSSNYPVQQRVDFVLR